MPGRTIVVGGDVMEGVDGVARPVVILVDFFKGHFVPAIPTASLDDDAFVVITREDGAHGVVDVSIIYTNIFIRRFFYN